MTEDRQALIDKFQRWLDTSPSKKIIAAECANIAEKYAEQLLIPRVRLSLPDDETIENESYEYVDNHIYVEDGHDRRHETCRQWAFEAGANWMKEQIKGSEA